VLHIIILRIRNHLLKTASYGVDVADLAMVVRHQREKMV
jgi:hypothetical protein